jgi:predicted ester cyclase
VPNETGSYDRGEGAAGVGRKGGSVAQNASTARSTYDAWNERDFDRFAEVMAKGELINMGTGERLVGREGALQFAHGWANGFPDGRVTIDTVIESGKNVVIEFTGRGTHTGTLVTPMGDIEPTGRTVELKLCDVWTFAADGTPKSVHFYFDTGSLMTQIGLAPQPAVAGATA